MKYVLLSERYWTTSSTNLLKIVQIFMSKRSRIRKDFSGILIRPDPDPYWNSDISETFSFHHSSEFAPSCRDGILVHKFYKRLESISLGYSQSRLLADFKENHSLLWFEKSLQKICEPWKLESIHEKHFVKRINEGREPDINCRPRIPSQDMSQ